MKRLFYFSANKITLRRRCFSTCKANTKIEFNSRSRPFKPIYNYYFFKYFLLGKVHVMPMNVKVKEILIAFRFIARHFADPRLETSRSA